MRAIIIGILFLLAYNANAQVRDYQVISKVPKDTLWMLGNETNSSSPKYGLGKWWDFKYLLDSLVDVSGIGDTDWLKLDGVGIPNNTDSMSHDGYVLFKGELYGQETKIEALKEGYLNFNADSVYNLPAFIFKADPLQTGVGATGIGLTYGVFDNTYGTRKNNTMGFGINPGSTESGTGLTISFEGHYSPTSEMAYHEFHLVHRDSSGNDYRPWSWLLPKSGTEGWLLGTYANRIDYRYPNLGAGQTFVQFERSTATETNFKILASGTEAGVNFYLNTVSNNLQVGPYNGMPYATDLLMEGFRKTQVNMLVLDSLSGNQSSEILGRYAGINEVGSIQIGTGLNLDLGVLSSTSGTPWYKVGTTVVPTLITDDRYFTGKLGINISVPEQLLHVGSSASKSAQFDAAVGIGAQPNASFGLNLNSINFAAAGSDVYLDEGSGLRIHGGGGHYLNLTEGASTVRTQLGIGSGLHSYFNTGGNVIIGGTVPSQKLHVVGQARITDSGDAATTITGRDADEDITDVGTGWGVDLDGSGNLVVDSSEVATQYDISGLVTDHGALTGLEDDDHLQYPLLLGRAGSQVLNGGVAANEDMTINGTSHATKTSSYVLLQPDGGNVGIGTAAPAGVFEIWNPTTAHSTMLVSSSGRVQLKNNVGAGVRFLDFDSYAGGSVINFASGNALDIQQNGTTRIIIANSTGKVGIANSSPQQTLHVTGTMRLTGSDGTATAPMGRDADGDVSAMTEGFGINYTGGSIEVDTAQLATQYDLTLTGDDWGGDVVNTDITLTGDGTSGDVLKVDTSIIATQYDLTTIADTDDQGLTIEGAGPTYDIAIDNGTDVTIQGAGILTLSESPANTLVFTATEVDGDPTNELQTISNTSDATSHTQTLSDAGGSTQFIEGTGITLTTGGTEAAATVTIATTIVDTDTYATVKVDNVAVSTDAPTLDFSSTDFGVAESPTDEFQLTIQAERIQDIAGAMVTGNTETGITVTYQDADGTIDFVADDVSATNELNTIEENNVSVQTGNITLDFQTLFDVATDGASEVNISLDLSEATTVTTPEADDWVIMHDAGAAQHQKILWSDLYDLVVGGGADGNGIFSSANDGSNVGNSTFDVGVPGYINFDANTLVIDGAGDMVGIGTLTPDFLLDIESNSANVLIHDLNGGTGNQLMLRTNISATGTGVFGGISFQHHDAANIDAWDIQGNRRVNDQVNSTLAITANEGTSADVFIAEKNANFSDNTTESHIAINGGFANTQNYEWTATSADLTIDRSYNILNVSGSGALGDEINLPEVASTSDNWSAAITSAQVQVGQEYTISNFRAATNLVVRTFTGDVILNAGGATITILPGESYLIKCVRWVSGTGVGYWKAWKSD